MNRRLLPPCSITFCCGLTMLLMVAVHALRAAPVDNIPDADKTNPNTTTISNFIATQVTKLTGEDSEARRVGREKLIGETLTSDKAGNVAPFLSTYATTLNGALGPALNNQNVAVRLNAAIAVARVAEKTASPALQPAVLTLLNDKSDAVKLWGLKAAKFVLPAVLLASPPPAAAAASAAGAAPAPIAAGGALIKAIAAAGQSSPVLLSDAYEALSLNFAETSGKAGASWNAMVASTAPQVLSMLNARAAMYKNSIPPEPLAERPAANFLTTSKVWSVETAAQKLQVAQAISDLIGMAAQRAQAAQGATRDQLVALVKYLAQISSVLGTNMGDSALQEAGRLASTQISPATQNIPSVVASVTKAISTVKGWEKITPPPTLAPLPATAPASGPAATAPSGAPSTTPGGGGGGT